jgi:hypothetical protein
MSWGWKIFLVFMGFVGLVLFMVFSALNQEFHLVADNYYEKEINYQGEMDMIRNARALKEQVIIEYQSVNQTVVFTYPAEHKDDRVFAIASDESGRQTISVKTFKKGLWQVKINWTYGATGFQEEKNLTLQ